MDELSLAREWYRYNARVRDLYLEAILKLPTPERLRDQGASFPSLMDVFVHVLDAYAYWFRHVARNDFTDYHRRRGQALSEEDVREAVRQTNALVNGYLDRLRPEDLDSTLHATYVHEGRTVQKEIRVRDMVWHLVEEELQHRGELNAMLWQMGREPPVWSWDDWKNEGKGVSPP